MTKNCGPTLDSLVGFLTKQTFPQRVWPLLLPQDDLVKAGSRILDGTVSMVQIVEVYP